MSLRKVIYFEYFIGFFLCIYFYLHFQFSLLIFLLLLLVPDICMIGYLANPKIGALLYNIGHSLVCRQFSWSLVLQIHPLPF